MCTHTPHCPPASDARSATACTVNAHPEQGWSRLCNGVILFEDHGMILPSGAAIPSPRASATLASI